MTLTPLNETHLETLLKTRRGALVSLIRDNTHRATDSELLSFGERTQEVGDWPSLEGLDETQVAMLKAELAELSDIDAALSRLGAGSYGACVSCGASISPERLTAQPTAIRCLACQEESEKAGAGTGHI
jgi:DnaK suppressor protein